MSIVGFDHVQLAIPRDGEDRARAFYGGVLGLPEVEKPEHLVSRGGCWFEGDRLRLHLGVETDFRPARKAHPAFLIEDLELFVTRLERSGVTIVRDESPAEGIAHVYLDDPFGNRLELIERRPTG